MRTHAVLYDRALTRSGLLSTPEGREHALELLMRRELLIVDPSVYHELEVAFPDAMLALRTRCRLYFNPWGHASYRTSSHPWPVWQLAPGDLGLKDYVTSRGVHLYRQSDLHLRWLLVSQLWPAVGALAASLAGSVNRERVGVFLDDMSGDRRHWALDPAVADVVWSPADGKPGWRDGSGWNLERIELLESMALALAAEGLDGVVVNGSARRRGRRMFEGFGQWCTPEQVAAEAQPGDLVQVNGALALPDGSLGFATVDDDGARYGGFPLGTSFSVVYSRAVELAETLNLRVGLSYRRRSDASIFTLLEHPAEELG